MFSVLHGDALLSVCLVRGDFFSGLSCVLSLDTHPVVLC